MKSDDLGLRKRVDEVIEFVADAQDKYGYINTYFTFVEPNMRWTNLQMMQNFWRPPNGSGRA